MTIVLNGTTGITNDGGYTGDGVVFADTTPANTLVTTTGGNVGVGTAIAPAKLTVGSLGVFRVQTGSTAMDCTPTPGATDGFVWNTSASSYYDWAISGSTKARIDSSGNLLVGMTDAFGKISVGQSSQLSYGQGLSFYFSGSSYWTIVNGGSNRLFFGFNGSDRAYIDSSTGAFVPVSDQRLKKNIADISYGISSVLALRPVSYNMKDQEDTAEKTLGFIAQDALQVVPESISEMMGGMLGMDKSALIPVLVKAIQEQQAIITALTARVEALEGK